MDDEIDNKSDLKLQKILVYEQNRFTNTFGFQSNDIAHPPSHSRKSMRPKSQNNDDIQNQEALISLGSQ